MKKEGGVLVIINNFIKKKISMLINANSTNNFLKKSNSKCFYNSANLLSLLFQLYTVLILLQGAWRDSQ